MPLIKSKSKKAEMRSEKPQDQSLAVAYNVKKQSKKKGYAKGGMVRSEMKSKSSLAEEIMRKRKEAMQHSGESSSDFIDLEETNAENLHPDFDDQNEEAGMSSQDSHSDDLSDQPEGSNLHSDSIEEDLHDMVSAIRKKMRSLRK